MARGYVDPVCQRSLLCSVDLELVFEWKQCDVVNDDHANRATKHDFDANAQALASAQVVATSPATRQPIRESAYLSSRMVQNGKQGKFKNDQWHKGARSSDLTLTVAQA